MLTRRSGLGGRFWSLFASSTMSNLGDGIGRVGFPLLAATLTRDPVLIASFTTFAFLPWLLFALVSGALVDRLDRRRVMMGANLFRSVVVGALAASVVAGEARIWMLYVAAFLLGTAETLYDSAARAILPQVVRRDQLEAGNGRLEASEIACQSFLGAPVGSALFVVAAAGPFLANSVGFLIAAVLLFLVPGAYRVRRGERAEEVAGTGSAPRSKLRREIGEGLRWLWRHRFLRSLMVLVSLVGMAQEAVMALLVLYVLEELALGEAALGLFLVGAGAGGLVGGLLSERLVRGFSRGRIIPLTILASGCAFALTGLVVVPAVLAVGLLVGAAAVTVFNVTTMVLRQTLIPAEMFGRVQGAWRTLVWGMLPLGALLGGVVAAQFGVRALYLGSGVLQLGLALALWAVLRGHRQLVDGLDERGGAVAAPASGEMPAAPDEEPRHQGTAGAGS
ncbi:MFS transporter [Actinoalloteichus spitiensis]|uniref:MFS transporter n=1 Tax=Actinoalloteichus spitiensis TaxID=252394 RepID=UPI001B7FCCA2|nr:MFS transporter [Actinoalloteichus spitiensis]